MEEDAIDQVKFPGGMNGYEESGEEPIFEKSTRQLQKLAGTCIYPGLPMERKRKKKLWRKEVAHFLQSKDSPQCPLSAVELLHNQQHQLLIIYYIIFMLA